MSLSVFTLSIIFISIHTIFFGIYLVYLRKRLAHVYGHLFNIENRLNYHAVALAENEILPMPWEIDELEEIQKKVKLDKEDNVVYITRTEEEENYE